jgi:hypothetical protein
MKSKDFASVKKYLSTVEEMQKALSVGERAFCSSICDAIDIELEKYNEFLNKGSAKFNKNIVYSTYNSYYMSEYYLCKDVIKAKIENLNKIKYNLQKAKNNFNEIDFDIGRSSCTEMYKWFKFDEIKKEIMEFNA